MLDKSTFNIEDSHLEQNESALAVNPVEIAIKIAINHKASDVHVKSNRQTRVRVKTELKKTDVVASIEDVYAFCRKYMPMDIKKIEAFQNKEIFSIDSTVVVYKRRLRLHLYRSNNDVCCTLRLLSESIPELSKLNLPASLAKFIDQKSGLVLITGATGSGKTTTIASIVNEINKRKKGFILTIEDPVEYVYTEAESTVEQREVGHDVVSFSKATVDALREDPDVIVVGEMRDLETIQNAITLAETGHLVFGTLHTKSVIESIDRIVDIFPSSQQQQVRVQISSILNGVVHQTMLNSGDNIVVLCEVLMMDNVLSGMLKNQDNKSSTLRDYMRSKGDIGCVHLVDNAFWHINAGRLQLSDVKHYLSEEDQRLLANRLFKGAAFNGGSGHN
jgi:twitching motility protein PilT